MIYQRNGIQETSFCNNMFKITNVKKRIKKHIYIPFTYILFDLLKVSLIY